MAIVSHIIIPIVEGHGEFEGVRVLLQRLWYELQLGGYLEVERPIRRPKGKLRKEDELVRAVEFAGLRARRSEHVGLILIMFDADDACPVELVAESQPWVDNVATDQLKTFALPKIEVESWLIAGRSGFEELLNEEYQDLQNDFDPDTKGKGWLKRYYKSNYSETVDFPGLCSRYSVTDAREQSRSFKKLCKECEILSQN